MAAARVKRLATQKKSGDHVITNVIQTNQQVANSLAQGGTIQHIGGTIITSGTSVVGKSPIQGVQSKACSVKLCFVVSLFYSRNNLNNQLAFATSYFKRLCNFKARCLAVTIMGLNRI